MPLAPLLAFGFASPLLLWGALLGAIPIVLHLLHRRRHRETPWAAMRFLLEAVRRNQRRIRLEQLLLLAIRVLILLLLAVALAQPFADSFGHYFQADLPTHRVLVLDTSLSLGALDGEDSRFERAREIARDIVSNARQGDAFNLLRMTRSQPKTIIAQPSFQRQQVLSELNQLSLSDEPGDLNTTLRETLDALARAPEITRKEVYFLTDLQTVTWSDGSEQGRAALKESLKKIGEVAEIVLVDVGQASTDNVAITDLAIEESIIAPGRPFSLQATLRNFGRQPVTGMNAELFVDGRLAESRKVDLPTGTPIRLEFRQTLTAPGEHALELRIPDDRLRIDNKRWLSLPVRDAWNVLLVNGRPAGKPSESATWYVEKSLNPSTERQPWEGTMRPTVISEGDLASSELSRYDCIFLCDVRLITDREATVLRNFVQSGGGLVICPAGRSQLDNYNQMLGPDGVDLLPGRLEDPVGNARDPQDAFEFATGDLSHPIVLPFRGNPGTGLESTLTFQYVRTTLPKDSSARVPLRYSNGDAAIAVRDVGRGRVILWTTTVDPTWSTWAVQRSFPPLILETVLHAVSGPLAERRKNVGEPIVRTLPNAPTGLAATVKGPDGKSLPATVTDELGVATVRFETTDRAGLYELTLTPGNQRNETFAVNIDPVESDLARDEVEELRTSLFAGIQFESLSEWIHSSSAATGDSPRQRGGLTRWLLLTCLILLFVEQLLAWNFIAGVFALLGGALLLIVRAAFAGNPTLGLVVAGGALGFIALGLLLIRRRQAA